MQPQTLRSSGNNAQIKKLTFKKTNKKTTAEKIAKLQTETITAAATTKTYDKKVSSTTKVEKKEVKK